MDSPGGSGATYATELDIDPDVWRGDAHAMDRHTARRDDIGRCVARLGADRSSAGKCRGGAG
jgi:hypothetical protein